MAGGRTLAVSFIWTDHDTWEDVTTQLLLNDDADNIRGTMSEEKTARNSARNNGHSRRRTHRRSSRVRWLTIGCAGAVCVVIGIMVIAIVRRGSNADANGPSGPPNVGPSLQMQSQSNETYTAAEINAAVNQLFSSVNPSLPDNQYFTEFARDKISWIITEQKAGRLSLILLKNLANTNLDVQNLMAAGRVDGNKAVIVIARPRFVGFLVEGGRTSAPFTQQQRNDFALGLVHEAVHLQNPDPGDPASLEGRLREELRAWREVNSNVVRQFRTLNQPVHPRLIEADDALRSCEDRLPCEPLRMTLLPSESRRH